MTGIAPHHIETARLALRPLGHADAEALHRLWTAPGVRRYLWDDDVIPRSRTRAVIEESLGQFETRGCGLWGVYPREKSVYPREKKEKAPLIGFCGYWFFHEPPELGLLYGLDPACWGRGLATECVRALIRYGFERLGLACIRASTDAANAASQRVMGRAGMVCERRGVAGGLDTLFYALPRPPAVDV